MSYTSSWLNKTFADLAFRFHHGNIANAMKNYFLIMERTVLPPEVSGFCLSKMSINSDLPRQEQRCCNTSCMEQLSIEFLTKAQITLMHATTSQAQLDGGVC